LQRLSINLSINSRLWQQLLRLKRHIIL
jgi:hypothetical protein